MFLVYAEIGILSVPDGEVEGISVEDDGVKTTHALGARAVYGNELCTDSIYYGSYNDDGTRRCFKDLTVCHKVGWCSKDLIRVCVNLDSFRIKYYLNGRRVRKVLSLQSGRTYYPFVCFAGNCQYLLR